MEWRHYLKETEKPVTVYTDHQNLQYFLTIKVWTHRQIRWVQKLYGFNFKILYRSGAKGGKPDALSRRPEYGPEEGATNGEQQILQPKHFGKFQITVVWDSNKEQLQQGLPQIEKEIGIGVQRLSEDAQIPTKGSKLAAGHDLYSSEDINILANNRALVKIGLAIAVLEGTYGRIAPRSGVATKGILVDTGVIDADYRGEVKVLLVNHNSMDNEVRKGDRIAQLIVELLDDQDWMEVEEFDMTERAEKGFGSCRLGMELKEVQPTICFLQADGHHQFYDPFNINQHPMSRKGPVLLSNAIIAKASLRKFEEDFLSSVKEAAMEDEHWMRRKEELETLTREEKELPKQWSISEGLLYYKDRLFIPDNENLQTLIAKSCHDSKIAGHFGQEKTLEIITRDFYWKKITDWVNDCVRSCTTCQQVKAPRHARFGLPSPLQVPYAAWASTSVDFIMQLPNPAGYTYIMVVVDQFTKMAHFIGLQEKATAKEVAEAFLKEVWKLHWLPSEIIADIDAKFAGEF